MPSRVIVVGSCMMDLVSRVAEAPGRGETVLGADFITTPGGKGLNQAIAAARMGAGVSLVSRVGDDPFGRQFLDLCDAEGIGRTHLSTDSEIGSGVSLIIVDSTGDNRIVANPRANAALGPAHVGPAFSGGPPDALLMCHETPDAPLIRGAELARSAGAVVVFNAAPASPVPAELMALVDVVVVNESEDALDAARALTGLGPATAIVTLGSGGAVFQSAGEAAHVEAFSSVAVDATGAGDAFCGALPVGLCEGLDVAAAVRLANAAGALAVRVLGAAVSLPRRADVIELAGVRL